MVLSSIYSISATIYNYLTGYVKVKCSNCERELLMYYKDIIPKVEISCSHGCTFELYNKYCKTREEK
jgi:hypothetical protein